MIKLGVVMDPMAHIKVEKDSTLAMLLAAQERDCQLYYMEQADIYAIDDCAYGTMRELTVADDNTDWFQLGPVKTCALAELDVLLMRKDPPFDMHYIFTTYVLQLAQQNGVWVVNDPSSLREINEKFFITRFPDCCPATLVTCSIAQAQAFIDQHQDVVVKPLDGMGGKSIFRIQSGGQNQRVILETISQDETYFFMAQTYIPEIQSMGDKRILLIDGEPVPYALTRLPAPGDMRGNLAAGGKGQGIELTERDRWLCARIGPTLSQMGIVFAGIDVIGDYVTEINVTSPTCIREIDAHFGTDIAGDFIDCLLERVK